MTLLHRIANLVLSSPPVEKHRPIVTGLDVVLGSYPPLEEYDKVGKRELYFLHDGYQARQEPSYFDDTSNEGEWQDEVYRFAKEICAREHLNSVCDVGCGSGFKLMKYFETFRTIGLDVEKTVARLGEKYPARDWHVCDFCSPLTFRPDLVISSDVIEHLPDPDLLLGYIRDLAPRFVVLSTPDRNLLRRGTHNGPPSNAAHIREWSMPELRRYVGEYFQVVDHFISNASQCTQCILAVPKRP